LLTEDLVLENCLEKVRLLAITLEDLLVEIVQIVSLELLRPFQRDILRCQQLSIDFAHFREVVRVELAQELSYDIQLRSQLVFLEAATGPSRLVTAIEEVLLVVHVGPQLPVQLLVP
jgi:hypothetical protein